MNIRAAIHVVLIVILALGSARTFGAERPETPHLVFVTEFVRELAAVEDIRKDGEKELKQDPGSTFSSMIHTGTLYELEIGSEIKTLNGMHLNDPFDKLIPTITGFYEWKIVAWKQMVALGGDFMGGPKPGVDYGKLSAEMPQIRARLDYVDQSIFKATPLVCETLIDLRPDSKNHTSHLIITKAERAELIDTINISFGKEINEENPNYTVSSAKLLKEFLLKDFKSSDEPWE